MIISLFVVRQQLGFNRYLYTSELEGYCYCYCYCYCVLYSSHVTVLGIRIKEYKLR